MKRGSSSRMIRIRLIGAPLVVEELAQKTAVFLIKEGYEMLEFTDPKPCKAPDEDKDAVYMQALKKGE